MLHEPQPMWEILLRFIIWLYVPKPSYWFWLLFFKLSIEIIKLFLFMLLWSRWKWTKANVIRCHHCLCVSKPLWMQTMISNQQEENATLAATLFSRIWRLQIKTASFCFHRRRRRNAIVFEREQGRRGMHSRWRSMTHHW